MMTKGNHHIKKKEFLVQEWVANGTLTDFHISSKCNISDIFMKEMKEGANF
jgi:hypothetical protein